MKVYDVVLGENQDMQSYVTPENEREVVLHDPGTFEQIFDEEGRDDDDHPSD